MLEGIEQRVVAKVEGVIVGKGDGVDSPLGQAIGRHGRGPKEERFSRRGPASPARRDAALEVEDEEVGAAAQLDELVRQQRRTRILRELLGDAASQHRVAGESQGDGHSGQRSGHSGQVERRPNSPVGLVAVAAK